MRHLGDITREELVKFRKGKDIGLFVQATDDEIDEWEEGWSSVNQSSTDTISIDELLKAIESGGYIVSNQRNLQRMILSKYLIDILSKHVFLVMEERDFDDGCYCKFKVVKINNKRKYDEWGYDYNDRDWMRDEEDFC